MADFFNKMLKRGAGGGVAAVPEKEGDDGRDNHKRDDGQYEGLSRVQEEPDYFPSIARGQVGEEHVADNSSDGEGGQEFFNRVLHGARANQKWSEGKRRRQKSRDGNGARPPSLENLVEIAHSPTRKSALESFPSSPASQAIREVTPDERTCRGHEGVVNPGFLSPGAQNHQDQIHAAGKRNGGVIEQPEGNQAHAAEVDKPAAKGAGYSGCGCGD